MLGFAEEVQKHNFMARILTRQLSYTGLARDPSLLECCNYRLVGTFNMRKELTCIRRAYSLLRSQTRT